MQPSQPTFKNENNNLNSDNNQPAVTVFTNSPHLEPAQGFEATQPVLAQEQSASAPPILSDQVNVQTPGSNSTLVPPIVDPAVTSVGLGMDTPSIDTPGMATPNAPNIQSGRGSIDGMRYGSSQPGTQLPDAPVPPSPSGVIQQPASYGFTNNAMPAGAAQPAFAAVAKPRRKRKLFAVLAIILVLILLLGGSAGAYFMAVLPNKPENVLKQALANIIQEQYVNFDGTLESSGDGQAVKATFKGQSDAQANAFQAAIGVTAYGVTIPVETRLVDKTVYIKFTDLSVISSLLGQYSDDGGASVKAMLAQISGKWISIDSTLLAQADLACVLEPAPTPSEQDIKLLLSAYESRPFAKNNVTTTENVNGKSALKYSFDVDNKELEQYIKSVSEASFLKSYKDCGTEAKDTKPAEGTSKVELWVTKADKQIVRASLNNKQEGQTTKLDTKLSYEASKIEKPTDAIPLVELLAKLGVGSSVLNSLSPSAGASGMPVSGSNSRQSDIDLISNQAELYKTLNGQYPTTDRLKDTKWYSGLLQRFNAELPRDPASLAAQLSARPVNVGYTYVATAADGKPCNSTTLKCELYTLTTLLDNGQRLTKKSGQ